ncbi:MAG: carboxypeptidase M32, partial [Bacteroidota bacterium]
LFTSNLLAQKDIPRLNEEIRNKNYTSLLAWLREGIHQYGQMYNADDLCKKITGESISFNPFLKYAEKKFGEVYSL